MQGMKILPITRCSHGVLTLGAALAFAAPSLAQSQVWINERPTLSLEVATSVLSKGSAGSFLAGRDSVQLFSSSDLWISRHDAEGNELWLERFGTSASDNLTAMASDGGQGALVAGHTEGSFGGAATNSVDCWLANYDASGNQAWIKQFGSGEIDNVLSASSDGSGGVYLCGTTWGDLGGPSAGMSDLWVGHFDSQGDPIWIQQFGTSEKDSAQAVVADGQGGAFVAGYAGGAFGGPWNGSSDVFLMRINGGGIVWLTQFGTSGAESATTLSLDSAGGVFVAGGTSGDLAAANAGLGDAWFARFDASGTQSWIRQAGSPGNDAAQASAPDGAGGLFVSGSAAGDFTTGALTLIPSWIAHVDPNGDTIWLQPFGEERSQRIGPMDSNGPGSLLLAGIIRSPSGPSVGWEDAWIARFDDITTERYCGAAAPNSTGSGATTDATGSNDASLNVLSIQASNLPASTFGFFITSRTQGFVVGPGGSQGNLCLGGEIGRYVGPGQIQNSGAAGTFELSIDLTAIPSPSGSVQGFPGELWNFQAWYRDANPSATSNFTEAIGIRLR